MGRDLDLTDGTCSTRWVARLGIEAGPGARGLSLSTLMHAKGRDSSARHVHDKNKLDCQMFHVKLL